MITVFPPTMPRVEAAAWSGVRPSDSSPVRCSPGAMKSVTVRYDVDHVQLLTPDVALTGIRQEYLDVDGQSLDPWVVASPTYIWLRTSARWQPVVGQNTAVTTAG